MAYSSQGTYSGNGAYSASGKITAAPIEGEILADAPHAVAMIFTCDGQTEDRLLEASMGCSLGFSADATIFAGQAGEIIRTNPTGWTPEDGVDTVWSPEGKITGIN